jgi:hypothetical protein
MKFKEIVARLTGLSCPVFGVSWDAPEAGVTVARRIVSFLEDKRVLYNPSELEVPDHCVHSVCDIRQFLTHELGVLDESDKLRNPLLAMRAACRKFLDAVGVNNDHSRLHFPAGHYGSYQSWVLNSAVGELRGVFGIHIAQLAAQHGLDVEDDLASILPPAVDDTDE